MLARAFFLSLVVNVGIMFGEPTPPIGTKLRDWKLPEVATQSEWSIAAKASNAKAVVVLFLGTECPVNNQYVPKLIELHKIYAKQGVAFFGINSNDHESESQLSEFVREKKLTFPLLRDVNAKVADRFQAKRTPEAFVLDGESIVRYRGRIDDQFERGVQRAFPTKNDLRDAIDAVMSGKEVQNSVTEVSGCPINRSQPRKTASTPSTVSYSTEVSRLIQAKCQSCHRAGEAAPFTLMNYRDAKAWSEAIRESVQEDRMPPWNADPLHGKFSNARNLSTEEKKLFLTWIDQGCPEGDPSHLPQPKQYVKGWRIGTPDQIISMREPIKIPSASPKGGYPYRYVLAGNPIQEDGWIQAIEARPDQRGVVHHILVYAIKPGVPFNPKNEESIVNAIHAGEGPDSDPLGDALLCSYVPGDLPSIFPDGFAKKLKKGSQLVFEMHYTPNGTEVLDQSRVGIIFSKKPVKHQLRGRSILNTEFLIPPLTSAHPVEARYRFKKDVVLLSFSPHMHLRGKSFQFLLTQPNQPNEILANVPKYDFNWQMTYELAKPRLIPKGSVITCKATFDNSAKNPHNPNPLALVGWGDQTWEEMMIGFVEYYDPNEEIKE
jgi:peroxiredoxin